MRCELTDDRYRADLEAAAARCRRISDDRTSGALWHFPRGWL